MSILFHQIGLAALGLCLVLGGCFADDLHEGSVTQQEQESVDSSVDRLQEAQEPLSSTISGIDLTSENEVQVKSLAEKALPDDAVIRAAETYEFQHISSKPTSNFDSSQSTEEEPVASASHDGHHNHHHPKVGLSVGGPLVNIARGAAAQAHNFEKSQPAAAAQAAYVAKNRLGQSAGLSAATAAAAFAGKQIILRGLEQQTYNAHRALEGEKLQLQQAQRSATAAANSAQQAMHQVQVITTALNAAQATSQHASTAASEAAAELAAQTAMVGAAKARVQALEDQLRHARVDFEAAQRANLQAAQAARLAQNEASSDKQQNLQAESAEESNSSVAEEPDDRESVPVGNVHLSPSVSALLQQQHLRPILGMDELNRANLYLDVPGAIVTDRNSHPVPDEFYVYDSYPY
ncbi:hypothetical protein QAD02_015432 [Eretmocerus hayati]|uniref:Uncharacterized protein n=1 Tax=Eretmocerus hayati TaxID=131215 RepID=A0ACC2P7S4_9HYME|nr:hypothetical protein QAD02_015432 [Eretmocerus hayati]